MTRSRTRLSLGSGALVIRIPALAVVLPIVVGALLSCAGSGSVTADAPPRTSPAPEPLVLISIDGFRWDYLDQHPVPTLRRLAREGVHARALIPVFPTKTFPSHYTIVTGLYPERHGIVTNTMLDPTDGSWFRLSDRAAVQDGRWWGGEPIWVTAQRQGLRSATLFWPGSEAPVAGVRPSVWLPYDASMPPAARVDRALEWLSQPADRRPSLITLYFEEVDDAGHDFGPASPQTAAAVANVDHTLERLVRGLESRALLDEVNLVLVSDHGMTDLAPERVIVLEDLIDLDHVEVVAVSSFAMLRPKPGHRDSVLEALRNAHPRLAVYSKEQVPERLAYREHRLITPIVALADEGWYVYASHAAARRRPLPAGMHGYDPALPSMHGLFVARGPAFATGVRVEAVHAVDLYALMARALDLEPATNDGDPERILELLEATPTGSRSTRAGEAQRPAPPGG